MATYLFAESTMVIIEFLLLKHSTTNRAGECRRGVGSSTATTIYRAPPANHNVNPLQAHGSGFYRFHGLGRWRWLWRVLMKSGLTCDREESVLGDGHGPWMGGWLVRWEGLKSRSKGQQWVVTATCIVDS